MSGAATNFGVVLFNDGNPQSSHTHAACQVGQAPIEFSSVSELSSQVLWVTNASLTTLMDYGLHKNPKLAHDGYFRTTLRQIMHELGILELEPARQVSLLAHVLGNAAGFARSQLGMVHYPTSSVAQGVGQMFGTPEAHDASDLYQVAERSSQRYTSSERSRRMDNAEVFSFWMPRYDYAQAMLTCDLPQENLSRVPPTVLPGGGADSHEVVQWAVASKLPVFAQVHIHSLDQSLGRLINHGSGAQDIDGQYQARNFRDWCALPELATLVQSGEVEIRQVLVSSGWCDRGLRVLSYPSAGVSYAYGLVAENLWCGLMRQPTTFGRISKTLATAWLQSYDRMRMLNIAARLNTVGFEVLNFGNGRVTVACPPALRAMVPQVALENGLMYPGYLDGLQMYTPVAQNRSHVLQALISSKDFSSILSVDNVLMKELSNV